MSDSVSEQDAAPPSEPEDQPTRTAQDESTAGPLSASAILALVGAIETLTERVETIEERVIETLPALSRNIDSLNGSVATLESRTDRSGGSLERAVMRLSARIQELEASTGDTKRGKTLLSGRRGA